MNWFWRLEGGNDTIELRPAIRMVDMNVKISCWMIDDTQMHGANTQRS
jgi:hypothetical protein